MLAIDLPHARRLAYGVVLGQAVVSVLAALAAWGIGGARAGLSGLLGGGIATLGSLAMAGVGFLGGVRADPLRALGAFYLGEAVKLVLVIALFVVVLKVVRVVPLAMFAGFGVTFLVYWIALLTALPHLGGARRGA